MFIPLGIGRIDAVGFDRQVELRIRRILTVERELPFGHIEATVNPANVEMPRLETDRGMDGVVAVIIGRDDRRAGAADRRSNHHRQHKHCKQLSHEIVPF